jgi:putative membrane protein
MQCLEHPERRSPITADQKKAVGWSAEWRVIGLIGAWLMFFFFLSPTMAYLGAGWLWFILLLALIAISVYEVSDIVSKKNKQPVAEQPRGGGALDIARERYARGEITREEFDQMQHDLEARSVEQAKLQ